MDSYISRLKDDVQCSLCDDTLTEPKILKCFHIFCKPCIKRHAELIEEVNVFKCPQCKSKTPLPDLNSVEDLRPSLLHSRVLDVLEFVEGERVCSVSEIHSRASWHCFDCNRSLCDECEKSHSLFIKDHNLVSLAGMKEEDIKLMLSRETNCEHHVDKLVESFCKDCEKAVCVECLKCGHEGHLTRTLSNYAEEKRTFLSEKLEHLRQLEKNMETKFMAVETMNVQFKESCEKAKLEVKEMLQKILEILQKKALELTNQIDDEILKAEKIEVENRCLLDQQRGMISYLNKLLEKGIASEVIDENEFIGKAEDIFQFQEKDNCGMVFVTNQELLKQAYLGLGILDKLEDTQHTIGSAIVYCLAPQRTLATAFRTPKGSWECTACMMNNKATATLCFACSSSKPTKTVASPSNDLFKKFAPPVGSWNCETCLVPNKSSDDKCVACQTPKPSSSQKSSLPTISSTSNDFIVKKFAPGNDSWECRTCMIKNNGSDSKCAACQTPKPGSSLTRGFSLATGNAVTKSSFTFAGASTVSNTKTNLQFGTTSSKSYSSSPSELVPLKFGCTAVTTTIQPITFGGSSESKKSESSNSSSSFVFGKSVGADSKTSDSLSIAPNFTFGAGAASTTASKPTIQFGVTVESKASDSTKKEPPAIESSVNSQQKIQFGAPAKTDDQKVSPFIFGRSKPAVQFESGSLGQSSSPKTSETPAKIPAFGSQVVAPSATPFNFNTAPTTNTGFNFGGAQPSSTFKFGASQAPSLGGGTPGGAAVPAFGAPVQTLPAASGGFNFGSPATNNISSAPPSGFMAGSGSGAFNAGTRGVQTKIIIKKGVRRMKR